MLFNINTIFVLLDNVEECILATQEKIIENEHRLGELQSLQNEAHEEVNNDLKRIQDQIYEVGKICTRVYMYDLYMHI